MKQMGLATLLPSLLLLGLPAQAVKVVETPVTKVVSLLTDLKTRLEAEGAAEQKTYDRYACWCETTLGTKASEITASKDAIEALQSGIIKFKGDLGAHTATIKQLKKDIAANIESQKETEELRAKEKAEYAEEKEETEQCIGALEAAINVLSGAGTGKKGFLETLQEARLLSVVAGVQSVLAKPLVSKIPQNDLQVVKHFVESPDDFVHSSEDVMSAAQIAQNPYGDYSPRSSSIQGILKSMYDSFTSDLEKCNAEEGDKQKTFEQLMATKKQELATLQATLTAQERDEADKTKQVAEDRETLDDTKEQLAADEAFFAETKSTCQEKASEWAERSRLRTEEMHGIDRAVAILSSDKASEIFKGAMSLAQISSSLSSVPSSDSAGRTVAYKQLKALATKTSSLSLAKIAVSVKTGGHFDTVLTEIDRMIKLLRAEEQDDVAHRDRCQAEVTDNNNDMEDINHDITKVEGQITRLGTEQTTLQGDIEDLSTAINLTKASIEEVKELRAAEIDEFRKGVQYDTDAIALLEQAITALSKYYQENGMPLELAQTSGSHGRVAAPAPALVRPEIWSTPYSARTAESSGIIAILSLIKEDLEKEVVLAREADAAASKSYVAERNHLQQTLESQTATKISLDKQLAELQRKIADLEEAHSQKGIDLQDEQARQAALYTDCSWVKTHFESRRSKRKTEIDGLIEAQNFLQGMESEI